MEGDESLDKSGSISLFSGSSHGTPEDLKNKNDVESTSTTVMDSQIPMTVNLQVPEKSGVDEDKKLDIGVQDIEDNYVLSDLLCLASPTPLNWEAQKRNDEVDNSGVGTSITEEIIMVDETKAQEDTVETKNEVNNEESRSDSNSGQSEDNDDSLNIDVVTVSRNSEDEFIVVDDEEPPSAEQTPKGLSHDSSHDVNSEEMETDEDHNVTCDNSMPSVNVSLWHEYDLNKISKLVTESKTEFMKNRDNYFRGCKW